VTGCSSSRSSTEPRARHRDTASEGTTVSRSPRASSTRSSSARAGDRPSHSPPSTLRKPATAAVSSGRGSSCSFRSARTSSAASRGRSAGRGARQRSTTVAQRGSRSGTRSRGDGGGSSSRRAAARTAVSATNGCAPVSISKSTRPNAYTSVAASISPPCSCSGAMASSVPMRPPSPDSPAAAPWARPKSMITARSGSVGLAARTSITFEVLKSRCTRSASCTARRPDAICIAKARVSSGERRPCAASRSASVSPSSSSIVRMGTGSADSCGRCTIQPKMRHAFGCVTSRASCTSRLKRSTDGACRASSGRSVLSATRPPSSMSSAS
jgi:hypothetical protein